jgi:hypothetical protein
MIEWEKQAPIAFELRKELLHRFRLHFRVHPHLMEMLKEISRGVPCFLPVPFFLFFALATDGHTRRDKYPKSTANYCLRRLGKAGS